MNSNFDDYFNLQNIDVYRAGRFSKDRYQPYIAYTKGQSSPVTLSVIVVAGDETEAQVASCLASLTHAISSTTTVEILLVDDAQEASRYASIINTVDLYIRTNRHVGMATGRNIGSLYSQGKFYCFLDATGYLPTQNCSVSRALSRIENNQLVAVMGRTVTSVEQGLLPADSDLGEGECSSMINAAGISIWRASAFKRAQGFVDGLDAEEGQLLTYRLISNRDADVSQFVYFPRLILKRDTALSAAALQSQDYQTTVTRYFINNKYPGYVDFLQRYAALRLPPATVPRQATDSVTLQVKQQFVQNLSDLRLISQTQRIHFSLLRKPAFSVIIPCYNLGSTLREAVDSVLAQTLADIEIIVVDDASTDAQTQLALQRLPICVEVIHHSSNSTVSKARNTGMAASSAPYILCLDADDKIEPTYLEKAFHVFKHDKNTGIVGSWMQHFAAASGVWKPDFDRRQMHKILLGSPTHTASCFRRCTLEDTHGYDTALAGFEDWEHWINIIRQGWELTIIPEVLFHYRVREGSKVSRSYRQSADLLGYILAKHQKFLGKQLDRAYSELFKAHVTNLFLDNGID